MCEGRQVGRKVSCVREDRSGVREEIRCEGRKVLYVREDSRV